MWHIGEAQAIDQTGLEMTNEKGGGVGGDLSKLLGALSGLHLGLHDTFISSLLA